MDAGQSTGIILNFVSRDQVLIEKIRYHANRQEYIQYLFSDEPCQKQPVDIFIIPANMIDIFFSDQAHIKYRFSRVIAFGSRFFLRKAFLHGCVDYLKEPWDLEEYKWRIRPVIRHIMQNHTFSWGKLSFDGQSVVTAGQSINLTYQEYVIFKQLLRFRGELVPREVLGYAIWDKPGPVGSRTIDMHISVLRKKLVSLLPGKLPDNFIQAVRGKGYILGA